MDAIKKLKQEVFWEQIINPRLYTIHYHSQEFLILLPIENPYKAGGEVCNANVPVAVYHWIGEEIQEKRSGYRQRYQVYEFRGIRA